MAAMAAMASLAGALVGVLDRPAFALLDVQAEMLKDINPGTEAGSDPSRFIEFNGSMIFTSSSATQGVYKTDGTPGGTVLVKSMAVGSQGGFGFTRMGDYLYFGGDGLDGLHNELWRTDGTPAGTTLVKDINPIGASTPVHIVAIGNTLYFRAHQETTGVELWKSDGTPEGTVLVKDINPAEAFSNPAYFTAVGSTVVFIANDGVSGIELWKTDGTSDGTVPVKDIFPGGTGSMLAAPTTPTPPRFTALGGALLFAANDGVNGTELWKTDGTADGTILVKDIRPGAGSGAPTTNRHLMTLFNGRVWFQGNDGATGAELWATDGTTDGTVLVADLGLGSAGSTPDAFTPISANTMLFAATVSGLGRELWKTDGTGPGTVLVKDVFPGAGGLFPDNSGSKPGPFAVLDGFAYFAGTDATAGRELFRSDGSAANTELVTDIQTVSDSNSVSANLTTGLGTVFFSAVSLGGSNNEPFRLVPVPVEPPAGPVAVDFDGDATSDVGVYRPSTGVWYVDNSTAADTAVTFGGVEGDIAVPADYDGDAKADVAIYRPSTGVWYIDPSTAADSSSTFGISGDIPVPADYDGDAKADIAIYRPATGVWYIDNTTAADAAVTFGGEAGDIPVVGDYDGDAKADIAVFRPSTGVWYVDNSTAADVAITFGATGDIPVPADYDGDAKTDIAVFRPSTGVWYTQPSTAPGTATGFGVNGDVPVLGDYDGDGKADLGVFRPSTSVWYIDNSTAADTSVTFGTTGDLPLGLPNAIYRFFF